MIMRRNAMNTTKFWMLSIVPILLVILLISGCSNGIKPEPEKAETPKVEVKKDSGVSAEDVKQETKEALDAAKEYALQQKEEYQKKMETKLEELDNRIDKVKAEAKESTEEAKAGLEKRIKETPYSNWSASAFWEID